jgi:hypothetical protein
VRIEGSPAPLSDAGPFLAHLTYPIHFRCSLLPRGPSLRPRYNHNPSRCSSRSDIPHRAPCNFPSLAHCVASTRTSSVTRKGRINRSRWSQALRSLGLRSQTDSTTNRHLPDLFTHPSTSRWPIRYISEQLFSEWDIDKRSALLYHLLVHSAGHAFWTVLLVTRGRDAHLS